MVTTQKMKEVIARGGGGVKGSYGAAGRRISPNTLEWALQKDFWPPGSEKNKSNHVSVRTRP